MAPSTSRPHQKFNEKTPTEAKTVRNVGQEKNKRKFGQGLSNPVHGRVNPTPCKHPQTQNTTKHKATQTTEHTTHRPTHPTFCCSTSTNFMFDFGQRCISTSASSTSANFDLGLFDGRVGVGSRCGHLAVIGDGERGRRRPRWEGAVVGPWWEELPRLGCKVQSGGAPLVQVCCEAEETGCGQSSVGHNRTTFGANRLRPRRDETGKQRRIAQPQVRRPVHRNHHACSMRQCHTIWRRRSSSQVLIASQCRHQRGPICDHQASSTGNHQNFQFLIEDQHVMLSTTRTHPSRLFLFGPHVARKWPSESSARPHPPMRLDRGSGGASGDRGVHPRESQKPTPRPLRDH